MDFVDAEIPDQRGGNVIVSTSHFESPTGCSLDNIRSGEPRHFLTWFCGAEPRVSAADMNWANKDGITGDIPTRPSGVTDLRKQHYPTKPGYAYNGVLNMNAKPGSQGRVDRFCVLSI